MQDDNGVRENQSMEAFAKLRPVFDKHNGTVTAGNSSQLTDGAVALLVMSEDKAEDGSGTAGYLKGYSYVGVDPQRMGLGPRTPSRKRWRNRAGLGRDSTHRDQRSVCGAGVGRGIGVAQTI